MLLLARIKHKYLIEVRGKITLLFSFLVPLVTIFAAVCRQILQALQVCCKLKKVVEHCLTLPISIGREVANISFSLK